MTRYIDADALLEILRHEEEYNADIHERADGIRDAIMDVLEAPTAEVSEIVHCKDCVHYNNKACRKLHTMQIKRTDFCSFGERRE